MSISVGSLVKFSVYVILFFVSVLTLSNIAEAGNSDFVKLDLESSYQIQIPKTWTLHNDNTKKTITKMTDSKFSDANIKQIPGQSRILVAG